MANRFCGITHTYTEINTKMSRPCFNEVCEECFQPVLKKSVKLFLKTRKMAGIIFDKPVDAVLANFGQVCDIMSGMFLNAEIHRECLVKCVADSNFVFCDPNGTHAEKFATDVDLLHALCQAHPNQKYNVTSCVLGCGKMSVEVYRYLLDKLPIENHPALQKRVGLKAVNEGNEALARFVWDNLVDVEEDDVADFLWTRNGGEFLSCKPAFKTQVIDTIDGLNPEYIDDIVKTNIQNLLERNYICAGDICYKIQ